jgi:type I restriction enzyme S subunit
LTANKSFILGYTDENDGVFENGPVIIFDDFTTASKYVDFPFKVKSSALKILKLKDENYDLRFVFGKMQLIRFPMGDHKRYWISEYQHIEIEIPSIKEEQAAIATVLADMDAELGALEQRRDKTWDLKQGMMQELLTGRIRLV